MVQSGNCDFSVLPKSFKVREMKIKCKMPGHGNCRRVYEALLIDLPGEGEWCLRFGDMNVHIHNICVLCLFL